MNDDLDLSLNWETVELNLEGSKVDYNMLRVKIWGSPSLSELLAFMGDINDATKDFKGDYISLTDFTKLDAGLLLESIISISMSKSLKKLIGVKNKAKISFVLFGEDSETALLKRKLEDLNKKSDDGDYAYNYVFIEDEKMIKQICEEKLASVN